MDEISVVKPTPSRAALILEPDDADKVRRLTCRNYNPCLNVAANNGWRGFSCYGCQAFVELTEVEKRSDMDAMARMIRAIR